MQRLCDIAFNQILLNATSHACFSFLIVKYTGNNQLLANDTIIDFVSLAFLGEHATVSLLITRVPQNIPVKQFC